MKRIPIYDETAPIACTITTEEVPARLALLERMRDRLDHLERTEHGVILHFPADPAVEEDLRLFAVDEKRCCEFWGFEVLTEPGLALRWDGPPSATELLDGLTKFLAGEEPVSSLHGLL